MLLIHASYIILIFISRNFFKSPFNNIFISFIIMPTYFIISLQSHIFFIRIYLYFRQLWRVERSWYPFNVIFPSTTWNSFFPFRMNKLFIYYSLTIKIYPEILSIPTINSKKLNFYSYSTVCWLSCKHSSKPYTSSSNIISSKYFTNFSISYSCLFACIICFPIFSWIFITTI